MRKLHMLAAMAALIIPGTSYAQSITPESFSDTIALGTSGDFDVTVSTPTSGPATDLLDIVFLADNTGSMGGEIGAVQSEATRLLSELTGTGADINFGVTSYFGDPVEFSAGSPAGNDDGTNNSRVPYNVLTPLTSDTTAVQDGIDLWRASGGGDGPEGGLFALHQIATDGGATDGTATRPDLAGLSTGIDLGFRPGATKIVVWFGDIGQHTNTVDVPEAITALNDAGITVLAINSGGNLNFGGDTLAQATDITTATGGLEAAAGSADLVDTILSLIGTATSTVDLGLTLSETFPGLPTTVTCISPEGCDDVGLGESRVFNIAYDGDEVGVYTFAASVDGLSGLSVDPIRITVTDAGAPVPLPAAALFFGTGLAGFAMRRKRQRA